MLNPQRDVTEYKNLALWKEKDGYVIRKGFGRVGCYVDKLTRADLIKIKNFINLELATDEKWREINEHKRLIYK